MAPKARAPQSPRLYHVKRGDGGTEVLCVPPTARLTIYAGKVHGYGNLGRGDPEWSRASLPSGGQLRIYRGNQLIGFFPDILELHEIDTVSIIPQTLAPQPKDESVDKASAAGMSGGALSPWIVYPTTSTGKP